MTLKKKSIKKTLDANTTVKKKVGKEPEEILKEGELPTKINKSKETESVGMSIGVTLNLGDFQSLRIDCWATENLTEGETKEEKLINLTEVLKEHLEYVANEMQE